MCSSVELKNYLTRHNFSDINVQDLSNALLNDMKLGLQEKNKSQQLMAVMPFQVNTTRPQGKIIVIDAGGTNFRSCLVEFAEDGTAKISEERKSSMIALDREYSKADFFAELEQKISYLKNKASEIHFCFSYAMKSLPDGDAEVLAFSKQVKAQEVVGSRIGKELLLVLKQNGWTTVNKIKLINDTVACLLAGLSNSTQGFDAYMGFILGTGINNAYIEKGKIAKQPDALCEHVVVCECGMFKAVPLSDFDLIIDKESTNPGRSLLEKMCSGVYIGKFAWLVIGGACKEGLFSADFARQFETLPELSAYQIDLFLTDSASGDNVLETLCRQASTDDKQLLTELLKTILMRSAKITASVIIATAKQADAENICVTCNGSTFWKTTNFKETVEKILKEETKAGGTTFTIIKVENDITVGTALA